MNLFKIDGITRVNQFEDPTKLKDTEVTVLENMVLNIQGNKAIKRGAIEFNIYGTAGTGDVGKLYPTRLNNIDYLLAAIGTKLRVYNGSWSDIPGITLSNTELRLQTYLNSIFFCNGEDSPMRTDLNTSTTLEIQKPDVRGIDNYHISGGSLTNDVRYRYRIAYLTDLGEESEPSLPFTHYISTSPYNSTDSTYRTLKFVLPASTDPRVKSIVIYRTAANGEVYYFHSIIDNKTTAWIDNKADSDLLTSEQPNYTKIPSMADYMTFHKERLWLAAVEETSKIFTAPNEYLAASTTSGSDIGGYTWEMVVTTGTSTLDIGDYQWGITFIDKNGVESDIVYSGISTLTTVNGEFFTAQNIPTFNYVKDLDIIKCKVYRTKANGSVFYYHPTLTDEINSFPDPLSNTYTDKTGDSGLSTTVYSPATVQYDSAIVYSEPGQPANIKAISIIQIFPDDGDKITGIFDDYNGVIVFKENSICKIYVDGTPTSWRVVKLVQKIGCTLWKSLLKIGTQYYFAQFNKIYKYSSNLDFPISLPIDPDMELFLPSIKDVAYSKDNKWYMILLTDQDYDAVLLVYDEIIGTWYKFIFSSQVLNSIAEIKTGTYEGKVIFGGTNVVLEYNKNADLDYSGSDNSIEILCKLKSKIFQSPSNSLSIRGIKILSKYNKKATQAVSQKLYADGSIAVYDDVYNSGITYRTLSTMQTTSGNFKTHTTNLQYEIEGMGLKEFYNTEIQYYLTPRKPSYTIEEDNKKVQLVKNDLVLS